MDRKKVKKEMLPFFKNYFDAQGFVLMKSAENVTRFGYEKKTSFGGLGITFHFEDSGKSANSLFKLSLSKVEDVILRVGVPYNQWEHIKNGESMLYTIKDLNPEYKYLARPSFMNQDKTSNKNLILSKEDIEDWKECFVDYFENAGADFATRYSYLPNVLEKIDEIRASGKRSFTNFICGQLDQLFRVLIISKLCGDVKFDEKKQDVDSIILNDNYKEYHSHYSLLQEELENLNPINIFKSS